MILTNCTIYICYLIAIVKCETEVLNKCEKRPNE